MELNGLRGRRVAIGVAAVSVLCGATAIVMNLGILDRTQREPVGNFVQTIADRDTTRTLPASTARTGSGDRFQVPATIDGSSGAVNEPTQPGRAHDTLPDDSGTTAKGATKGAGQHSGNGVTGRPTTPTAGGSNTTPRTSPSSGPSSTGPHATTTTDDGPGPDEPTDPPETADPNDS